jgi:anti-sigma factor ChrR (cupin superfamily)
MTDGRIASTIVRPAEMEWVPSRFPGIATKTLYQDEATGRFTALFRWDPGAELPDHIHVELEQSFILEGSLVDEDGEVTAGNYVSRPAGSRHVARAPNGALVLAFFLRPNVFVAARGAGEEMVGAGAPR